MINDNNNHKHSNHKITINYFNSLAFDSLEQKELALMLFIY
jgi:hypothetical protein